MNSSSFLGNTTTMGPLDELISVATTLIGPDNELEVWSREPFYSNANTKLVPFITSTPGLLSANNINADNETMKLLPIFESPIVSAVRLALFMMVHSPFGTACVRGCSDILRSSLVSIVGPSNDEILAPFHSVIAKSRTNIAAQRKIAWICHSMRKFDICIKPCKESKTKSLRLATVKQWQMICNASKTYPKHFGEFIGCERRHHERALGKCPSLKVSPLPSLDAFCRNLNQYTDCYSKVTFRCSSKNATKIWNIVNEAILESYSRILELTVGQLELPVECEWAMRNSDLYRHEDEGGGEYLVESLSWSSSTQKSTTKRLATDYRTTSEPQAESPTTIPSTILSTTTIRNRHREFENDEYNLDYWQGISEQPLLEPIPFTTTTKMSKILWIATTEEKLKQGTPFIANAFKNAVSSNNCSIFWFLTSIFVLIDWRF